MPISISGGQTPGTPVTTTQVGNITLNTNSVAEYSAAGTLIGSLSIDLPGNWFFSLVGGYDNSGQVALKGRRGRNLVTTSNPLVYSTNPNPTIRVVATSINPVRQYVADISLSLTLIDKTGPTPTIDMDLINKVYTGAALSDLGLVTGDLSADGYHANGAKAVTLGGAMATLLAGSGWTIVLECHQIQSSMPANLLSDGSAGSVPFLQASGWTSINGGRSGGQVANKVGMGGFLGISRIGIAGDSSGFKTSLNNGIIATSSTALAFSGLVNVLTGTTSIIRRISLWDSKLADADLRTETNITNRPMPLKGTAFIPNYTTETFFDDFLSASTIRKRPGAANVFNYGTFDHNVGLYAADPGNWIPRYVHWTDPIGSHLQAIGSAEELLLDPQYFGDGTGFSGFTGPFHFDTMPSCLEIRAQLTSSLPSSVQAVIPIRQQLASIPADTFKWKYVSGAIVAAGKASFGVNSLYSVRSKMPACDRSWAAIWALGIDPSQAGTGYSMGQHTELDVIELIGQTPSWFRGATHTNDYAKSGSNANNLGIWPDIGMDLSQDFHSYEVQWLPGLIEFGCSGLSVGSIDTTGTNMDSYAQFPIIDNSIAGTYPGPSTAATDAAMPISHFIDHVRIMSTVAAAPTLQPLQLSSLSGSTLTFSASVIGQSSGSSLRLIDPSGYFTLSGTTLTVNTSVSQQGSVTFGIYESLPSSFGSYRLNTFTVVLVAPVINSVVNNLKVTTTLAGAVGISWTAPTTGDAPINYIVEYRISGSGSWTTLTRPYGPGTFAVLTGANPGTGYDLRVTPVNIAGTGPASSPVSGATLTNGYIKDNFTPESANIILPFHTPDIGASWARSGGYGGGIGGVVDDDEINSSGRLFDYTGAYQERSFLNAVGMPTPDYTVSQVITRTANATQNIVGVYARANTAGSAYAFAWSDYSQSYELNRHSDGINWNNNVTLFKYQNFPATMTIGDSHIISLQVSGNTITGWVDGVAVCTLTDSTLPATGQAGLVTVSGSASVTATQIDYFEAR